MMKLFVTPASSFVRKCRVSILELEIADTFEIVQTRWPHTWGTHTVPFRPDFAHATPAGRIPALITDDGLRLTDSSVICEFINAEYGGYRLCPRDGKERWKILSVISIANAVLEAQAFRRAETLRQKSDKSQEYSRDFVQKMIDRQDRCYRVLDGMVDGFRAEPDLGQIALGAACGISDFRFNDIWRPSYPRLARWYEAFKARPSMKATEPAETPTEPDETRALPQSAH
jgi:glutathione S-transferase